MSKPKRIFKEKREKLNLQAFYAAINMKVAAVQIEIIKSQPETTNGNKIDHMRKAVEALAESTQRASKQAMLMNFRLTGRYVR